MMKPAIPEIEHQTTTTARRPGVRKPLGRFFAGRHQRLAVVTLEVLR